jgi:hypothetical protein
MEGNSNIFHWVTVIGVLIMAIYQGFKEGMGPKRRR